MVVPSLSMTVFNLLVAVLCSCAYKDVIVETKRTHNKLKSNIHSPFCSVLAVCSTILARNRYLCWPFCAAIWS